MCASGAIGRANGFHSGNEASSRAYARCRFAYVIPATGCAEGYRWTHVEMLVRQCLARIVGVVMGQAGTRATTDSALLPRALFTAEEVADALAVSQSLVRQLTLDGSIACRRIGRLVRYTKADIDAFVTCRDEQSY